MKLTVLLTVCAGLASSIAPIYAQDASPTPEVSTGAGTNAAPMADGAITDQAPVSVEIAMEGLSDEAKMSAAASAAIGATEARFIYVSDLQTGSIDATLEGLRARAAEQSEALDALRQNLSANDGLIALLHEYGEVEHVISATLQDDGTLLVVLDDEQQM